MSSPSPLVCRIALAQAKHIGPHNTRIILEHIKSVDELIADPSILRKHFPRTKQRIIEELKRPSLIDEARRIAEWCEGEGVRVYFVGDQDYPKRLSFCPDAPTVLYSKGKFDQWDIPLALGVVGTRNMTAYGNTMVDGLLGDLGRLSRHTLIVSGLAYGVDVAAHRKALSIGMPTVAVLAHGLDRIYPAVHRTTAAEMLSQGGWISEYPPGTNPDKYNFVSRNRIIAGLTDATLVVEAGVRSGSLITAEIAAGYNREVLAVPGRAIDKYSEGCNKLIAQLKGVLVTSGEDITKALGLDLHTQMVEQTLPFAEELPVDSPLLRLIAEAQPIQINDLIRRTGMDMQTISSELFDLEIDGHIKAMPGGLYVLAR